MKILLGVGLVIVLVYLISTKLFSRQAELPDTWINLTETAQLDSIVQQSKNKPIIIYKHSTQCGVCTIIYSRLSSESQKLVPKADFYYLDLLRYRNISNKIADIFQVRHESPQVLVIKNGRTIYHEDHYKITVDRIVEYL